MWPEVYRIYGTAIGILLKYQKHMSFPSEVPAKFDPMFLDSLGLARSLRDIGDINILMAAYYNDPDRGFALAAREVFRNSRKVGELRRMIKTRIIPDDWPKLVDKGLDFADMWKPCEYIRDKAKLLLDNTGNEAMFNSKTGG